MEAKKQNTVDEIGMKILRELQLNARSTFSEIGRKIGLSSPAVAERIYKMESAGIISGYRAEINPDIYGHIITSFITLTTRPDRYKEIFTFSENQKEILECYHISGNESLILKIAAGTVEQLDKIVEKLSHYGKTKTSIILSTPLKKRVKESVV